MSTKSSVSSRAARSRAEPHRIYHSYEIVDGEHLRVAVTRPANARETPLLIFNGIGASLDTIEPFMRRITHYRVITFDLPGIGGSDPSRKMRRMPGFAKLATQLLDKLGIYRVNVMGVSWGGGLAQQFALDHKHRCKKLILAATSTGQIMVPPSPVVMLHMATPLRYLSSRYFKRIAGTIYGGDFRNDPGLRDRYTRLMAPPSLIGYLNQLYAMSGWTSVLQLHNIGQPTLVMAGEDDPIVTIRNAHLLCRLIPNATLKVFDCGHLFILTRLAQCVSAIEDFLLAEATNPNEERDVDEHAAR